MEQGQYEVIFWRLSREDTLPLYKITVAEFSSVGALIAAARELNRIASDCAAVDIREVVTPEKPV